MHYSEGVAKRSEGSIFGPAVLRRTSSTGPLLGPNLDPSKHFSTPSEMQRSEGPIFGPAVLRRTSSTGPLLGPNLDPSEHFSTPSGFSECVAKRSRRLGFTLIELLVAISILAIVAVLGYRGLDSIVRSRASLNTELDQTRGMQLSFAQMQSDCSQNVNPLSYANIPEHRTSWIEPNRLILIRNVYTDDHSPTMQVVVYRLKDTDLIRTESASTRDLAMLKQLLIEARNPPDTQVEVVMLKNVLDVQFTGYPESSLNAISDNDVYGAQRGALGNAALGMPRGGPGTPGPQGGGPSPGGPGTNDPGSGGGSGGQGSPGGGPGGQGGSGLFGGSTQSDVIATQKVDKASVTAGLQVQLQLQAHANKVTKIFMLGGA